MQSTALVLLPLLPAAAVASLVEQCEMVVGGKLLTTEIAVRGRVLPRHTRACADEGVRRPRCAGLLGGVMASLLHRHHTEPSHPLRPMP